jgi:hypothetical protein
MVLEPSFSDRSYRFMPRAVIGREQREYNAQQKKYWQAASLPSRKSAHEMTGRWLRAEGHMHGQSSSKAVT